MNSNIFENNIPITNNVAIPNEIIVKAINHKPFLSWYKRILLTGEKVTNIHIQSVDMFGERVGFIKFTVDYEFNKKSNKSIVFLRSDSVAILVILTCKNEKYILLTCQPRIPAGSFDFIEIPAGMMDNEDNFVGVAAKELQEETGIELKHSDLKFLKEIEPSPGGTCERIKLFYVEVPCTEEQINTFQGKLTGNYEEGEHISLLVLKYDDVLKGCLSQLSMDAKLLSALLVYHMLKNNV